MKDLSKYLGRFREIFAQGKRNGYAYGRGEKYSLELGNNLSRALTSELAMLASPKTIPLFLQKYQRKQIKQYQRREPIYKSIHKEIKDPKGTTIISMKETIERFREFLDALKKSKDKSPDCLVKPKVVMKTKGVSAYRGTFRTVEEARASDKVICLIPSTDGQFYEMRKQEQGEFIAHVPRQNVRKEHIEADLRDCPYDDDSRYIRYADIHSHNSMDPFFPWRTTRMSEAPACIS